MHRSERVDPALLRRMPLPVPGGGKETRGSVFVVAGAPQMPGAAILAATAALRAGAGKLQIGTCASVAPFVGIAVPESLVVALDETPSGAISLAAAPGIVERANHADALVIGPGMVDEFASAALIVAVAAALAVPAVIDAAALACVGTRPDAFAHLDGRIVLTPHAGELASVIGVPRAEIEADPARYARVAAERYRAIVTLKGVATFIAEPGGKLYCNTHGTVGLGTSGSGDTLAGIIGGLLARGAAPLAATVWGVYLHAHAGERLAERIGMGFLARELGAEIPPLLRDLEAAGAAGPDYRSGLGA